MSDKNLTFYIAFDESHKSRGKIDNNYTGLKKYLESLGFICHQFMEFPITRNNLKPYDILVIPCPDFSKFSREEIDAIVKWVKEDGGGLLLLSHAGGDKGRRSNLSELSEKFGIQFENDQVLDKTKNFGIESLPEITNFGPPNPITEGITSICYRAGSSITTSGSSAVPVVLSNETSEPFASPLIVIIEAENGRVIGCGSYEIFRDKVAGGFEHDQHAKLAKNIFNWLRSDYRTDLKLKHPEIIPIPKEGLIRAPQLTESMNVLSEKAPNISNSISQGVPNFNIQSNITISNKSDLANSFNNLLQQVDSIRNLIKSIINIIITSEEKQIMEESIQYKGTEELQQQPTPITKPTDFSKLVQPPSSNISQNITNIPTTGLFGSDINNELTPLPPKPTSLSQQYNNYTTIDQPQYNNSYQPYTTIPQPYSTLPQSPVLDTTTQYTFIEDSYTKTTSDYIEHNKDELLTNKIDISSVSSKTPDSELNAEQIQLEIESMQSKINSIEDLKRLVEQKFQENKYSKKQYDKQIERLENDKKKALTRLDELQNLIKKVKNKIN